jgi:hypothetical protein
MRLAVVGLVDPAGVLAGGDESVPKICRVALSNARHFTGDGPRKARPRSDGRVGEPGRCWHIPPYGRKP